MPYYSRTRTKTNQKTTHIGIRKDVYAVNGSVTSTSTTLASSYEGTSRTMSDSPHPDFAKKSKQGAVIIGDMALMVNSRTYEPSAVSWWEPGSRTAYYYEGDFAVAAENQAASLMVSDVDISRMASVTLLNAFAEAHEAPVLSGEILSDLGKTVSMLRRPLSGIQTLVSRIRSKALAKAKTKGRYKGKVNPIEYRKACASAWLEHRYGMKPLMIDADNIMRQVAEIIRPYKERHVARKGMKYTTDRPGTFVNADLWGANVWRADGSLSVYHDVTVSSGVIYEVEAQSKSEYFLKSAGLRPRDLPNTLWEITPLSYVADWIVDVGTWLQAVTPVPGVVIRGSWTTTVSKSIRNVSIAQIRAVGHDSPETGGVGGGGGSQVISTSVSRVANPQLPSTPVVMVKMTPLRQADAAALLCNSISIALNGIRH